MKHEGKLVFLIGENRTKDMRKLAIGYDTVKVKEIKKSNNRNLYIEYPCAFLYPRKHLSVAEALMKAQKAGYNIIVSTHSEIVLARIGRRIAEGKFNPRDCKIVFFSKEREKPVDIFYDEEGAFYVKEESEEDCLTEFLDDFLGIDYDEWTKTIEAVEKKRKKFQRKKEESYE